MTTVTRATTSLATAASAPVPLGGAISDSAMLSGGTVSPTVGGMIAFSLYGPNDPTCSGTPASTSSVTVSGNSTYGSPPFTAHAAGTYQWVASYSGDTSNAAFTTACGAANESVAVGQVTPAIVTAASAASGHLTDTATLSGGDAPTGAITFALFGPGNPTCAGAPIFTSSAAVNGTGTYSSQPFTPTTTGTYQFVAVYAGDGNNAAAAGACGAAGESVVVSAPPGGGPPPPTVLGSVKQSARRWREGSSLPHISSAKPPVGTTFSFTLNKTAPVSLAFTQKVKGREVKKKRCVAQTKHNRHQPSCRRTITLGTLSFTGHSGQNKVSFKGRLSRTKRFKTGTYTVVITAGRSTGRLTFTIVK